MSEAAARVEEYRRISAAVRSVAEEVHFPEIRAQLTALASRFDVMADRVEDWRYPAAADAAN
jgi:hypothetical protein